MLKELFAPLAMKISGGIIALLLLALPIHGCIQYREGRADGAQVERTKWQADIARIRAERDAAMMVATENDAVIAAAGEKAIADARKELDNATTNIPDQSLSARQRARACYELQQQGRRCETDSLSTPGD